MSSDQREFEKLHKKWLQAKTLRKKTSKNCQEACAKYHWTEADDGAKWKRVLTLRDKDTAAFEREESAFEALVTFMRKRLS